MASNYEIKILPPRRRLARYNVFITSLINQEDKIISALVKRGYGVLHSTIGNNVVSATELSTLIVLTITHNATDCFKIHEDISKLLFEQKILVFSLIVSIQSDTAFCGSNISTNSKEDVPIVPPDPSLN